MGIRLTWADDNYGEDGHKVYRSESPMDPNSLPTELASLGPDVTQYDDGTVVEGTTYYYRVSAFLNTTELVSDEVSIEAGAFSPLILFANSESGAWYDPSDLSTLFIDTAGITPVTSDGDSVGLMLDKSGNGLHLTQATTSFKPIYRTNGTLHWLEFDGTDDILETGSSGNILAVQGSLLCAYQSFDTDKVGGVFGEYEIVNVNNRAVLYADTRSSPMRLANGKMNSSVDIYINLVAQSSINQTYVSALINDGSDYSGYLNESLQGSASSGSSFDAASYIVLGAQFSLYHSGAFYGGVIIDRPLNSSERASTSTYLGAKGGIIL